jgi:hypothetical protein
MILWSLGLQAHARQPNEIDDWFAPSGSGKFSATARSICEEPTEKPSDLKIWSPNHLRRISIRLTPQGDIAVFAKDEEGREFAVETAGWSCPEIAWSRSSDLFFASYSDGGAVGNYHVSAYRLSGGHMQKIDLTSAVRRDFLSRYPKCFSPEEPNIAGVAWSANSSKLLVAAEVLPHSNCDNMGTFSLYEVAVPGGKIVRRLSQLAAKASFNHLLGPELRAADDSCLTRAGSCRIPALHQTGNRRN